MEEAFKIIAIILLIFCMFVLPSSAANSPDDNNLEVGFYRQSCPSAEKIVSRTVAGLALQNSTLAAGLIRLHFHDCFVNGCDASILLDATPSGEPVEANFGGNGRTLRGLEIIDTAKARLEQECPGVVSCADILAFAARDAAVISGILPYVVPAGRRDGRVSNEAEAREKLPRPSYSVDTITDMFAQNGLTQEEMVVLSGAHSIGVAHCINFQERLKDDLDPEMDIFYGYLLKRACPKPETASAEQLATTAVPLDSITPFKLDNMYYIGLMRGKGLLSSDHALAHHPETSAIVRTMALNPAKWNIRFRQAMVRLGSVGVLTGNQGDIRHHCRSTN